MIYLCIILFIILLVLPFLPAAWEMKAKRDDGNLFIRNSYVRDPRYFSDSFKQLLFKSTGDKSLISDGMKIRLSKEEILRVGEELPPDEELHSNITVFKKAARVKEETYFEAEAVFLKDCVIGRKSMLRAAASLGNCDLEEGVEVLRWIDADGALTAAKDCNLGVSVSSDNLVSLQRGCRFKRIFAPEINLGPSPKLMPPSTVAIPQGFLAVEFDNLIDDYKKIEAGSVIKSHVVSRNKKRGFVIERDSVIWGSVKAHGELHIEDNVLILGNVFCDKDIRIGNNVRIMGDVFTHCGLQAGVGCVFGQMGKIKSVVSRDGLRFSPLTVIFGYVSTDGEGLIL